MGKELTVLTLLLFVLVVLVVPVMLDGWALSIIWNWFMPHFFGWPRLTILSAICISLIARYMAYPDTVQHQKFSFWGAMTYAIVKPVLAVLFALVLTWFL